MLTSPVEVLTHTEVARIIGDEHGIKAVEVFNNQTDDRRVLAVQAVVP